MTVERISMWIALLVTLASMAFAFGQRSTRLDLTEATVKELVTEVKELRNTMTEIRVELRQCRTGERTK